MCSRYKINGVWYETIEELSKIIPVDKMPKWDPSCKDIFPLNTCLCPIDHRKVADMIKQPVCSDCMDFLFGEHIEEIPERYKQFGEIYSPKNG